jgi:padR-like family transcriptional regulator protein
LHNTIFYLYLCLALQKNQEMNIENTQAQMRKGILEYCILLIISQQDAYVPDIISKLKASKMIVVEGTIYPLLTRLKNTGLLSYRWEESQQGPPRKYYSITEQGRDFLKELENSWNELTSAVNSIKENHNN